MMKDKRLWYLVTILLHMRNHTSPDRVERDRSLLPGDNLCNVFLGVPVGSSTCHDPFSRNARVTMLSVILFKVAETVKL